MADASIYRDVTYKIHGVVRTETMTHSAIANLVHLHVTRADKYELISVKPWARIGRSIYPNHTPRYGVWESDNPVTKYVHAY